MAKERPIDTALNKIKTRQGWNRPDVIAFRGQDERTFTAHIPDTNKFRSVIGRRRFYYKEDGDLKPIQLNWSDGLGDRSFQFRQGDYQIDVPIIAATNIQNGNVMIVRQKEGVFRLKPLRIQWRSDTQTGTARTIAAVAANRGSIDDSTLTWPLAFGPGTSYELVLWRDQFFKRVNFQNSALLGNSRLGQGAFLSLDHRVQVDEGTSIWYMENGTRVKWDGETNIKQIFGPLIFRRGGETIYRLRKPFIKSQTNSIGEQNRSIVGGQLRDRFGQVTETISWFELRNVGGNIIISSCFDEAILKGIRGPFFLDPSFDIDSADSDDFEYNTYASSQPNTGKNWANMATYGSGDVYWAAYFDVGSTSIGSSDSVSSAIIEFRTGGSVDAGFSMQVEVVEDADRAIPTDSTELNADIAAWSSNPSSSWTPTGGGGYQDSEDFSTAFEDAISAGGTIGTIGTWFNPVGTTGDGAVVYLIGYSGYEESLEVEWTAGSTTYTSSLAASTTPSGAIVKQTAKGLAATITAAGSAIKATARNLAGSITPAGNNVKKAIRSLGGSIAPAGSIQRRIVKALAGAITAAGDLTTNLISGSTLYFQSLAGSITGVGSLTKKTGKTFVSSTTPAGTIARTISRILAGEITPTGTITKLLRRALGGAITAAATVATELNPSAGTLFTQSLAGTLTPGGEITKKTIKMLAGAVSISAILYQLELKGFIRELYAMGPIAFWPLNEDWTTTELVSYPDGDQDADLDTGSGSGVAISSRSGPFDEYPAAYAFDGVRDWIDIYSSSLSNAIDMNNISAVFAFKHDDFTSWSRISETILGLVNSSGGDGHTITTTSTGGTIYYFISSGEGSLILSLDFLDVPGWQLGIIQYDQSGGTAGFYSRDNGSDTDSHALSSMTSDLGVTRAVIGKTQTGTLVSNSWDGDIGFVALFDKQLSGGERSTLFDYAPREHGSYSTASTTPSGSVTRRISRILGGTVSVAGSITRRILKSISGAIAPVGNAAKKSFAVLAGSVNITGILAGVKNPLEGVTTFMLYLQKREFVQKVKDREFIKTLRKRVFTLKPKRRQ